MSGIRLFRLSLNSHWHLVAQGASKSLCGITLPWRTTLYHQRYAAMLVCAGCHAQLTGLMSETREEARRQEREATA